MDQRQARLLIIICVVILGLFATVLGLVSHHNSGMGKLTVDSVPEDLVLTIDGKKVRNMGLVRVSPGHHTFKATRKGFDDMTKSFDIKKGQAQSYNFFLAANSPEGYQYLTNHPEQQYKIEAASGKQYKELDEKITRENPIITKLPVIEGTFRIDYGTSQKDPGNVNGSIALYITAADEAGKADALDWMKTFGYNPASYEIIYRQPQ